MEDKDIELDEKAMAEADLAAARSRREEIEDDPVAYAQERVNHLTERLSIREPRSATIPGHISMYDHLNNLKSDYEKCVKSKSLTGRVADDVAKLKDAERECEMKLNEVR